MAHNVQQFSTCARKEAGPKSRQKPTECTTTQFHFRRAIGMSTEAVPYPKREVNLIHYNTQTNKARKSGGF